MDSIQFINTNKKMHSEEKIKRFYAYELLSNLYFERAIFIIYLAFCGMSILQIALFQGVINIAMVIAEIPTGVIADKIGKKYSLIMGNILVIIYYILMLQGDKNGLICAALCFGIGSTFISGTDEAYLYDIIPERETSVKYLGLLSAIITFALGVAMVIGGYMQRGSWNYVLLLGLFSQIFGIIIMLSLPNITYNTNKGENLKLISIFKMLKEDITLIKIMLIVGFNIGAVSAVYILGQEMLSLIGVSTNMISIVFCVDNIIAVAVFSNVENILKIINLKRSIIVTVLIMIIGFLLLSVTNAVVLVLSILVISTTSNYLSTIFMDSFYNRIDEKIRATGGSICNMVSSAIMATVFSIVGIFQENYIYMLTMLGIVSSLLIVIFFWEELSNNFEKR